LLPKVDVVGSIPIARSSQILAPQEVEISGIGAQGILSAPA
jgi:hypothetical protein